MATSEEQRKQKIMEHLQKTTEVPVEQPSLSEARKQKMMEHIKMTRG